MQNKNFMFYIVDRGYFWTGETWTNVIQFASMYSFNEAITIMDKRFINKKPRPRIRRVSEFQKKKKKKINRRNESAIQPNKNV